MAYFAVQYVYTSATSSGRDETRASHRAWLADLLDKGVLVSSGPFTDDSGALIVVHGDDKKSVTELFGNDPFAEANLLENVTISEWKPVMGAFTD